MSNRIKIDIVSDVVCPWCIVGYKHLEAAIKELGIEDRVEIEWQPFELNSNMPKEGENLRDHVLRKYGAKREESDKTREDITSRGAEYGFKFDFFDEMRIVNTLEAHILLDFAHEQGLQHKLKQRLFAAYFTENKDVSDRTILLNEARSIGLELDASKKALDDEQRRKNVLKKENYWKEQGISGVPTVIFDRKSALTGAHPQITYKEVLKDLANL